MKNIILKGFLSVAFALTLFSCGEKDNPSPNNPSPDPEQGATVVAASIEGNGIVCDQGVVFTFGSGMSEGVYISKGVIKYGDDSGLTGLAVLGGTSDKLVNLKLGCSVDGELQWSDGREAIVLLSQLVPGDDAMEQYFGFKFKGVDALTHYGWARVTLRQASSSQYNAVWEEAYYEKRPNVPVVTGERP